MIGETCSTDSLLILIKLVNFLQSLKSFKMPFPHRLSTSNGHDGQRTGTSITLITS